MSIKGVKSKPWLTCPRLFFGGLIGIILFSYSDFSSDDKISLPY